MNLRRERILFRLADVLITLTAIFLLLDAMLGFTKHRIVLAAQSRDVGPANLSTSCVGGFSNHRTVAGVTQVAPHGTPFNAYQVTFTNIGNTPITVYGATVELIGSRGNVFVRQHDTDLGDGAGLTLDLGQSRRVTETTAVNRPIASCEVLSWQP